MPSFLYFIGPGILIFFTVTSINTGQTHGLKKKEIQKTDTKLKLFSPLWEENQGCA